MKKEEAETVVKEMTSYLSQFKEMSHRAQGRIGKLASTQSTMKAKSIAQQRAAGAALSAKRGEAPASELEGASKEMFDTMTEDELEEMASAKHDELPERVED